MLTTSIVNQCTKGGYEHFYFDLTVLIISDFCLKKQQLLYNGFGFDFLHIFGDLINPLFFNEP